MRLASAKNASMSSCRKTQTLAGNEAVFQATSRSMGTKDTEPQYKQPINSQSAAVLAGGMAASAVWMCNSPQRSGRTGNESVLSFWLRLSFAESFPCIVFFFIIILSNPVVRIFQFPSHTTLKSDCSVSISASACAGHCKVKENTTFLENMLILHRPQS